VKEWLIVAGITAVLGVAVFLGIRHWGAQQYQAGIAYQVNLDTAENLKKSEAYRAKEAAQAKALANADQKYQQDLAHAKADSDAVIAGLRAGNLRLRKAWACLPRASAPAASSGQPDAGTDDRNESAGRIVRAADDADAQIRGLQAVLNAEREVK
jgi:hypothetical protein